MGHSRARDRFKARLKRRKREFDRLVKKEAAGQTKATGKK
jgi:hypothetical protein